MGNVLDWLTLNNTCDVNCKCNFWQFVILFLHSLVLIDLFFIWHFFSLTANSAKIKWLPNISALDLHGFLSFIIYSYQKWWVTLIVEMNLCSMFSTLCEIFSRQHIEIVILLFPENRFWFVLRFYGPVNPMGSCRARSVYLTTRLLGRLSPLSG